MSTKKKKPAAKKPKEVPSAADRSEAAGLRVALKAEQLRRKGASVRRNRVHAVS